MASASLAGYDGSAGVLVDTNIWVDCIDSNSVWHHWAIDQLQACGERSALHVNPIIFTELLVPGPDIAALDALLDVYATVRSPLPWSCCALAAKAFGLHRNRGGAKLLPLPDFFIGAHAAVANLAVLTRDPAGYRSYFPLLVVRAPGRGDARASRQQDIGLALPQARR